MKNIRNVSYFFAFKIDITKLFDILKKPYFCTFEIPVSPIWKKYIYGQRFWRLKYFENIFNDIKFFIAPQDCYCNAYIFDVGRLGPKTFAAMTKNCIEKRIKKE